MNNYTLSPNETILYKGPVIDCIDGDYTNDSKRKEAELILTNENIVLIKTTKKLFREVTDAEIISVSDVKVYDDTVQVIRDKKNVNVYALNAEKFLVFNKEKDAKEFTDKALKLISGNSKFVRGVKKIQKSVSETEDALDVDITGTAKQVGKAVVDAAAEAPNVKIRFIGKVAQKVSIKKKSEKAALKEATPEIVAELPEPEQPEN